MDSALISSLSINDLYTDYWLYLPAAAAADKIRSVSTYTPSTGTITQDRVWSAATIANSKVYELHGMIRPFADELTEQMDWTQLINDALTRCMLEIEITVTPTADATRHDLTTANTWLTKPVFVRQVGYLTTGEVRAEVDPYAGRTVRGYAEKLSNLVYINHSPRTFASNQTIYVKCLKPAYNHCRAAAGVFGDQAGLALEADEAVPSVEWVAYGALNEASRRGFVGPNAEARKLWAEREERFARLYEHYRGAELRVPTLTFRPIQGVGSYGRVVGRRSR